LEGFGCNGLFRDVSRREFGCAPLLVQPYPLTRWTTLWKTLLSSDALRQLTGYARASKQRGWLDAEGIPYKERGSRLIVSARHVEAWIEGRPVQRIVRPDFSAVR